MVDVARSTPHNRSLAYKLVSSAPRATSTHGSRLLIALREYLFFPAALLLRHIGCFSQQIAFEP